MESVKTVTSLSLGSVLKRPEQTTTKPPTKPFVMASTLPPNSLGGGADCEQGRGFFFLVQQNKRPRRCPVSNPYSLCAGLTRTVAST